MELWTLRPHVILVKVIFVCGLHVFFHQYVADVRERKSENIFRTVSTSPLVFNLTVMCTSGAIATPPEIPVKKILLLTTVVSIIDDVSTVTPFVVPPPPDIERPVMQLHDFLTYWTPESRQSSLLISLSASSSALTLPRNPAKFSSSSFSLDRFQPLRGRTSPPTGEALLPPPADDCLIPCLDDPNTAVRCETFPGSEYPSSLPACATVRAGLDPPMLPTGSVIRISTTLPEGSSTSAAPVTPGEDGSLPSELPSCNTQSPAICCVPMETRHKDCYLFLFSPSSTQDVGSRSVSNLGVPFTSGLGLLLLSTTVTFRGIQVPREHFIH